MSSMCQSATAFNQNISSWNTASVTTMNSMFSGASLFNQNLSSWNVANFTVMTNFLNNTTAKYSATAPTSCWSGNPVPAATNSQAISDLTAATQYSFRVCSRTAGATEVSAGVTTSATTSP